MSKLDPLSNFCQEGIDCRFVKEESAINSER